ncbi:hypothetical protein V8F06_010523 [Rhypophila decipiens]
MDSSSRPDNPSTQPLLLRCPNEIILMFSELLGSAMESRRSFALTCRRVFEQTERSMYRDNIRHQEGSVMLWAAVNGNIEIMEKAIAAKGDISGHYHDANKTILKLQCPRKDGFPPCGPCPGCPICRSMWRTRYPLLHSALAKGQDDMAVYLVLKGADICEDAGPCFGWYMNLPAWKMWIVAGISDLAPVLKKVPADRRPVTVHQSHLLWPYGPRVGNPLSKDAIYFPLKYGSDRTTSTIEVLAAMGADVVKAENFNDPKRTPLYKALRRQRWNVALCLLDRAVEYEPGTEGRLQTRQKVSKRFTPALLCGNGGRFGLKHRSLQYAADYCCVSSDALDMMLILLELGFNADQISECSAPMTTCRCYQRFIYQTTGVSLRTPLQYLVDAFDIDHHVDFGIQYEEDMHAYLETCAQTVRLHSKEKRLLSGIDLLLSRGASPMRPWLSQSEKGEADDKITIMEKVLSRFEHVYNNHKDARVGLNTLKVARLFLKHAERSSLPAEMIDKLRHWIPAATRTLQQRPPVTNLTIRGLVWTGLPRTYDNNPRLYALMDSKYPRPGILEIFRPRPKPSLQRPISSVPSEYLCYLTSAEIPPADVLEDCSLGARYAANPPILMLPWHSSSSLPT